jgi:ribonuclease HI
MNYQLFTDGAVDKNPGGTASFGFSLRAEGAEIDYGYGIIGRGEFTNNVMAEYRAISEGLVSFMRHWDKPQSHLSIYCDSQFVVDTINKGGLRDSVHLQIIDFQLSQIRPYVKVTVLWTPREENQRADQLAKRLRSAHPHQCGDMSFS